MFPGASPQRRTSRGNSSIMVTSDPIADMLARIHNGYMAGKPTISLPWSKMKESLANVLIANRYLGQAKVVENNGKKELEFDLRYDQKKPAIASIRRISKPSVRVYVNKNELPRVLGGLGIAIISTPAGLLTDRDARKKGLGGEVICEIS